ncbi:hypothetical protein ACRS5S_27145 [Nocardia asiatica]|uniref:hypothetical protein n=1 Tax=Nocardia asiatica TaxID=209252 RepID=UPI0024552D8F|nr:hypothetical protein [Nocardia asiatica]
MSGGKFRAGIAFAVTLLVVGLSRHASRSHRIRNVVNGLRGARAARARRRRALRTRGAGIPGPRPTAAFERKVVQAA